MNELDRKYIRTNSIKIWIQELRGNVPIVIFTMGKTGSSSVLAGLRGASVKNPTYQVHLLSQQGINTFATFYRHLSPPIWPEHMNTSALLSRKLATPPRRRWKVISMVRDPIAVRVSAFFENLSLFHPEMIMPSGELRTDEVLHFLHELLSNYTESEAVVDRYFRTWFQQEFNQTLATDVFEVPFDQAVGHSCIETPLADVLLMRYEDMKTVFSTAINGFLNLADPIALPRMNVGRQKRFGEDYEHILEHIRLSPATCGEIYAAPQVTHFYTSAMIDGFTRRWGGRR